MTIKKALVKAHEKQANSVDCLQYVLEFGQIIILATRDSENIIYTIYQLTNHQIVVNALQTKQLAYVHRYLRKMNTFNRQLKYHTVKGMYTIATIR